VTKVNRSSFLRGNDVHRFNIYLSFDTPKIYAPVTKKTRFTSKLSNEMPLPTIDDLIRHFNLEVLPVEGGIFAQTYKSTEVIPHTALPARYRSDKPLGTAIVFLFTPDTDSFSAMHRLPTDEIYHFYLGDPIELLELHPDGRSAHIVLGQDILNDQKVQHIVPRGTWMGSRMRRGGRYALMGTTMAPGFTHDDFDGGTRAELIAQYPHEAALITELTRTDSPLTMPEGY